MAKVKKHYTWRYRSPIQGIFRTAARLLLMKPAVWGVLTVRVHNRKNLKQLKGKAFIVIANHSSHFDAPLVAGALPRYLARRLAVGAATDYFFKAWYKALPTRAFLNTFPVDRDKSESSRHKGLASQLLSEKTPILVMPEGTRSRTGKIAPFKPGVAVLSIKHQVPVLPIALVGAYEAWKPGTKRWLSGRPSVHVNFGEPLLSRPNESVEQFNRRMRSAVVKLYKLK
ncbi:MAG: 1-acyl-sn-glycerol-3-phosphate acyltransferase [Candidatus Nomurabacteria bacterium]|jgi:1-acyl-sn-glycerol-3-phosphate acyltransferase|nr:1-acyl-sn-glycerol-3-phosphate acyltransferase [Candidatus Nomurabacteria bacterium]